mmetsp:Transcript_4041/g.6077  ORF Transcript_4041/g.6077 Transcript_4041/m.6077 type:complete len:226 (-) Transcript_4041:200-877(-)
MIIVFLFLSNWIVTDFHLVELCKARFKIKIVFRCLHCYSLMSTSCFPMKQTSSSSNGNSLIVMSSWTRLCSIMSWSNSRKLILFCRFFPCNFTWFCFVCGSGSSSSSSIGNRRSSSGWGCRSWCGNFFFRGFPRFLDFFFGRFYYFCWCFFRRFRYRFRSWRLRGWFRFLRSSRLFFVHVKIRNVAAAKEQVSVDSLLWRNRGRVTGRIVLFATFCTERSYILER